MPLDVHKKEAGMGFEITERLYLTADRESVVPEGHPDAAFLYATPGKTVSDEEAEKYGLKSASKTEDKAVAAPTEDKAAAKAPAETPKRSTRKRS